MTVPPPNKKINTDAASRRWSSARCVRQNTMNARQGCLERDCTSFGLPGYVRLSPRRAVDNDRLVAAFAALTTGGI